MSGRKPAFSCMLLSLSVLLLVCASSQGLAIEPPAVEEMGAAGEETAEFENPLFVDPRGTQEQRAEFIQALRRVGKHNRQLVEISLPVIGANGALDGIESVWPKCHSQAHDLGKVIFARVRDVGMGLRVCADRCNSGCMHGVLMEAFTTIGKASPHHMNLAVLMPAIKDLCQRNPVMTTSYSPGDCAHGVGHALMNLAGYEIPEALKACQGNENQTMEYYCATGAYMEYVTERDMQDATTKSVLYPCDQYIYPAACARYKMGYVVGRHYKAGRTTEELRALCSSLADAVRRGCFHGLGNALMLRIAAGKIGIRPVCLGLGTVEESVCIDGAMERMAVYHPDIAVRVCDQLDGNNKADCLAAVSRKMFDMKKDLSLYLTK
jgi:hypothetical protein